MLGQNKTKLIFIKKIFEIATSTKHIFYFFQVYIFDNPTTSFSKICVKCELGFSKLSTKLITKVCLSDKAPG